MRKTARVLVAFIVFTVLLTCSALFAQKVGVKVDGNAIQKTIAYIASDAQRGRRANTSEFTKLQNWVVKQYRDWGLTPAGEHGGFYQAVPIKRNYTVTWGTPKLKIAGREFFSRFGDFSIDNRSTTATKIKQKIVFAGYGISAPDKGLDEYAGIDVQRKIVLVLKGNPAEFKPPAPRLARPDTSTKGRTPADREMWAPFVSDSMKIVTAYNKGAAAVIFYNPDTEDAPFRWRRRRSEKLSFDRNFLIISQIDKAVFRWIFWREEQMSSRSFNTWLAAVRADIQLKKSRSFDTGLKAEIAGFEKIAFKGPATGDTLGRNIIAKIPGSDPDLKNEYVVIGAHFDHVGVRNGLIYNGAEDNGTGSGVLINLARLMKENNIQTKRTIYLCLWTAEELGLIGSRHWVAHPTDGVNIDNVVTNFNMDMVGLGPNIGVTGGLNFPSIWQVINRDQDQDVLDALKPNIGGPGGSDYAPFITRGIEALGLMTGGVKGHPDYHDTGDDAQKLNVETLRKVGQFVLQGAVNVGNETAAELKIADREHIFHGKYWPLAVISPRVKVEKNSDYERLNFIRWNQIEAETPAELTGKMIEKVQKLKESNKKNDPFAAFRRRFGRVPRRTGIAGAQVFNHDISLMKLAKETLNFGRLDVVGDDGIWFEKGLTPAGKNALKELRRQHIALHLIKPTRETMIAVLEKSKKPILISGFTAIDSVLVKQIRKRKSLLAIDFDPAAVDDCVKMLEQFKKVFGDSKNFVLNLVSGENYFVGKEKLYKALIQAGWDQKEIYAIGGASMSRRGKSNLDKLPGGRPPFPGR